MSGGGSSGGSTTTTQKIELPKYAQPYAEDLLRRGDSLSNQQYQAYPNQKISPLTPEHEMALQGISNRAYYGSPDISAARGNLANTMAGTYMSPNANPWLNPMMDIAAGKITDAYRKGTAAQTDKMFSQANAFGGSAYREAVKDNSSALSDSLAAAANDIYYKNYSDERMNQMRGMMFAPQLGAEDYKDAQALLGVGDIRRGYSQDVMNQNYANWLDAQQYPYKQLDVLANSIAGSVGKGGVITQQSGPQYAASPYAGMIGGGMLGYGMGQQMGMSNPLLTAAGGALLGGLRL